MRTVLREQEQIGTDKSLNGAHLSNSPNHDTSNEVISLLNGIIPSVVNYNHKQFAKRDDIDIRH